jgi:hypothetical protein
MRLVFHICRELQRATATEVVVFVQILDQFPLDSTSRRFSYPFRVVVVATSVPREDGALGYNRADLQSAGTSM